MRQVDIEGFENYQITDDGRVWNKKLKKYLKTSTAKGGYRKVSLRIKNRNYPITKLVHRLVAEAFIPNPENLPCINHKDEDKTNNRVENLEFCTYKYNNTYGNRIKKTTLKKVKKVYQYTLDGVLIKIWNSVKECREYMGCYGIDACCRGERKTIKGYRWYYEPL